MCRDVFARTEVAVGKFQGPERRRFGDESCKSSTIMICTVPAYSSYLHHQTLPLRFELTHV